jgi:ATP/ADP translocase
MNTKPSVKKTLGEIMAVPIAVAVTVVWVVTALVTLKTHDYTPLSIVTPVMLLSAGAVFGVRVRRNGSGA